MGYFNDDYWDSGYFEPSYWGNAISLPAAAGCWALHPDGLKGTGVNYPGRDFPFVDPADDLRGVLADAYLAHQVRGYTLPLSVAWMYGFDRAVNCGGSVPGGSSAGGDDPASVHAVDILIVDGTGQHVFDSTQADYYAAAAFGPRLLIHEWRTATAVCRVVQHTAVPRVADEFLLPRVLHPERGQLDERVSELLPRRVDSVIIAPPPDSPDVGPRLSSALTLMGGYNVTFAVAAATAGLRTGFQVTVNAEPGSGAGRAPGCDDPLLLLRTINGQAAGAGGNFLMGAEGCLWLRRPRPAPGVLQLGYDCKPCCDCADYEKVQRGILRAWDVYEVAAADVDPLIDQYQAMIDRWNAQKSCREAQTTHVNVLANGPYVEVAASLCNTTGECIENATLLVRVIAEDAGRTADMVAGTGVLRDGLGHVVADDGAAVDLGDYPYDPDPAFAGWGPIDSASRLFTVATLPPQTTVSVRLRLLPGAPGDADLPGFGVAAAAQATGTPATSQATKAIDKAS